jgi:hypothetical protein
MANIMVNGFPVGISGTIVKLGQIRDEYWMEGNVDDPEALVKAIRDSGAKIDVFTFSQKLPETLPKYEYPMEWDNVAALHVESFDHWWTTQVNDKTRNMVRKAKKRGVEVRVANFDAAFVEGITAIYNETPIRQGRAFRHYGKDADTVRLENATFQDRCTFLGAYLENELIGFVKLVYAGETAGMMQILSLVKARDKAPNNALVAKAVELCAQRRVRYLTYSKFVYGKKGVDPVAEFKHHNGFRKMDVPKYYVPLNLRGRIGLALGLHQEFADLMPQKLALRLRDVRAKWYEKRRVALSSSSG